MSPYTYKIFTKKVKIEKMRFKKKAYLPTLFFSAMLPEAKLFFFFAFLYISHTESSNERKAQSVLNLITPI